MQYSKITKAGDYTMMSHLVTLKELEEMRDFIRNFKNKYSRKKVASGKKRNTKY